MPLTNYEQDVQWGYADQMNLTYITCFHFSQIQTLQEMTEEPLPEFECEARWFNALRDKSKPV